MTNLALRKGARVANLPLSPVMAITDTSDTRIAVETGQIDAHYVEPGHDVEITTPAVGCDPELRRSVRRGAARSEQHATLLNRRCDLRATRLGKRNEQLERARRRAYDSAA